MLKINHNTTTISDIDLLMSGTINCNDYQTTTIDSNLDKEEIFNLNNYFDDKLEYWHNRNTLAYDVYYVSKLFISKGMLCSPIEMRHICDHHYEENYVGKCDNLSNEDIDYIINIARKK